MGKVDLKKELSYLYKASAKTIELVTVPELTYLMVDGAGDPNNSKQFQQAIEALFSLSYTIKFFFKKGEAQADYTVMPLEGLWWADDMANFSMDKSTWKWTLMILQPDFITADIVAQVKEDLRKKKDVVLLDSVRLEKMNEGLCAQILHIGPFDAEPATIARLHEYIKDNGYQLCGKHREIYLSDMRRTAPEKMKTIIRQPVFK